MITVSFATGVYVSDRCQKSCVRVVYDILVEPNKHEHMPVRVRGHISDGRDNIQQRYKYMKPTFQMTMMVPFLDPYFNGRACSISGGPGAAIARPTSNIHGNLQG